MTITQKYVYSEILHYISFHHPLKFGICFSSYRHIQYKPQKGFSLQCAKGTDQKLQLHFQKIAEIKLFSKKLPLYRFQYFCYSFFCLQELSTYLFRLLSITNSLLFHFYIFSCFIYPNTYLINSEIKVRSISCRPNY